MPINSNQNSGIDLNRDQQCTFDQQESALGIDPGCFDNNKNISTEATSFYDLSQ